ncbi:hypothetical protein BDN71DRAFT_1428233 [Pleurotus eryngii]|uniref:Uncharacterized protein n=1 Tax=Pleurotus eryngii TaxID=5323 RepID=A0A9P6DID7_PLEER|nr:hypothetical protein BDN71DRAFT_1428233 [Pleurotus eryngii]
MTAFKWPPDGNLKGFYHLTPISNPSTFCNISNVLHLKHNLFCATDTYSNETIGKLVFLEHSLCCAISNKEPEPEPEPQGLQAVLQQMQQNHTTLLATVNAARPESAAIAQANTAIAATAVQANAAAIAALDVRIGRIDVRLDGINKLDHPPPRSIKIMGPL